MALRPLFIACLLLSLLNRIRPDPSLPERFPDAEECDLASFRPVEEEPHFLIPNQLEPGEMTHIWWRDTRKPVGGSKSETFVIGLPPEFQKEFQDYIEGNSILEIARKTLYEDPLVPHENRLYILDDDRKWSAMTRVEWETDLVWMDPADEECFESLLGVLRRGGFDTVLDKIGKKFDLNSLMIQGIGFIFLSEYKVSNNMHIDMLNGDGWFYNVIVPIHIPANDTGRLYVGEDTRRKGTVNMHPDVGIVLGGESFHGTGECDYRQKNDFRLSVSIYMADINEKNVDLIAADPTSLWPTNGDTKWFWAQQGRVWCKDGSKSLKHDKGRKPLKVEDKHPERCPKSEHLCESDLNMRLACPKTCKLYMEDDEYYSKISQGFPNTQPEELLSRLNWTRPDPSVPERLCDGEECALASFRPVEKEPHFLIPNRLEPGEMAHIKWRDTRKPVGGSKSESFVIGLPPEFQKEFQAYFEGNEMLELARETLYKDPLVPDENRLNILRDGMKWSAMTRGEWETDLVWMDPADEDCFESLLGVLRRGGFDTVLDKIGKRFDLNALMIQGVGVMFLSKYKGMENMHVDMPGGNGWFYNIIIPVHIPANDTARLCFGEDGVGRRGTVDMHPDVAMILGGESYHETGECNYRDATDFRLSVTIVIADINKDNADLIAADTTSLWPTNGDTKWLWAQQGRVWSKDGSKSLKHDKGRKPLKVEDKHQERCPKSEQLCESDLDMRLACPKTCKLYMEDDVYYEKISEGFQNTQPEELLSRPNRARPDPFAPERLCDGGECDLASFRPLEEEPHFLIPNRLEPGEMAHIKWRDTRKPVGGSKSETFVIGLPPEFQKEFQAYIRGNGMLELAQDTLYKDPLVPEEDRLHILHDGMKWSAMVRGEWDTDLVWMDPADEECFESLLGVLRRGGFDTVLDKIGKRFDLNALMIQGVGFIFLSEYKISNNMHIDMLNGDGWFYNVIVPIHIPANDTARLYVGEDIRRKGTVNMQPDVGIILGGESFHGTGECNYRETNDFRLSVTIYMADINEKNVELIAADQTSLWPTDDDTKWLWAQQGRVWSKDGSKTLKHDQGRKPLKVEDKHPERCPKSEHLCESDLNMRLACPKTCKVYLEDDVYYSKISQGFQNTKSVKEEL